jgi:hypothetical protein
MSKSLLHTPLQAAVHIQAAYRGYTARMAMAARWAAAQQLQAAARGFLVRRRMRAQVRLGHTDIQSYLLRSIAVAPQLVSTSDNCKALRPRLTAAARHMRPNSNDVPKVTNGVPHEALHPTAKSNLRMKNSNAQAGCTHSKLLNSTAC